MRTRRQTPRLLPHEDASLRALYREFNITVDQYPQRPDDLARLVGTWNSLTGRSESSSDILHYMITRRKNNKGKNKGWEKLGRDAGTTISKPQVSLSDEELKHLDAIHEELQIASDNYALNPDAAKRLQDVFAQRAGRIVPAMILAAAMVSRRKAGALATLKPKSDDQDLGFSDIDQISM